MNSSLSLTSTELSSREFLRSSLSNGPFTLQAGSTISEIVESTASHVLVCFGEGVNLNKLFSLQDRLSTNVIFHSVNLKTHPISTFEFAVKIHVQVEDSKDINALIESAASQLHMEVALLPYSSVSVNKPGVLLMDMDSTVIGIECIDELAKLHGCGEQVSEVTELAMQGKLDFSESLRQRVGCLHGASESILESVRTGIPIMPGASQMLAYLKSKGWKLAIASGGFTYFANYLKDTLSLDFATANQLVIQNGRLTGEIEGAIIDAQTKADTLIALGQQYDIPAEQLVAIGDGANDLVMMEAAALGVAFHAKPIVRKQAQASIRFGGLDSLIWLLDS